MNSRCVRCQGHNLDNYILTHMGIVMNRTCLRIEDHNLHCVPYNLGCRNGKLLVTLSPEEHELFRKYDGGMYKLYMTIEDPDTLEPVPLYINTLVNFYKKDLHENNFCFIGVDFCSPPDLFVDVVTALCDKKTGLEKSYREMKAECPMLKPDLLRKGGVDGYAVVRMLSRQVIRGRILEMSCHSIRIFTDLSGLDRSGLNKVKVEILKNGQNIFIDGAVAELAESAEVPGFYFARLDLQFSFSLAESLLPLYSFL